MFLKKTSSYILVAYIHHNFQSGIAAPDEVGARLTRRFEKSVRGLEQKRKMRCAKRAHIIANYRAPFLKRHLPRCLFTLLGLNPIKSDCTVFKNSNPAKIIGLLRQLF